jgi:hypothetical protein
MLVLASASRAGSAGAMGAAVAQPTGPNRFRGIRAFSGKVDTGFPSENATNKEQLERFPIQPDREAL